MKYKSKEEFIKICNTDHGFKSAVGRDITELDLKKYNILPNWQGEYGDAQKYDLAFKIKKEEGYDFFDEESIKKIISFQSDFKEDIENPIAQKFLIVYLADDFQKALRHFRETYGIPRNGFGPGDKQKATKWFMQRKKEIEILKGPKKIEGEDEEFFKIRKKFWSQYKRGEQYFLDILLYKHYGIEICNYEGGTKESPIVSQLWRPEVPPFTEIPSLLEKYNLHIGGFGLVGASDIVLFDLWEPLSAFVEGGIMPPKYKIGEYGQLKIILDITGVIEKQDFIDWVNKEWGGIKKRLNKWFGPAGKTKNLPRDLIVFFLRDQDKTFKEIRNIMKGRFKCDLNSEQIKKIISRTKKKIINTFGGQE